MGASRQNASQPPATQPSMNMTPPRAIAIAQSEVSIPVHLPSVAFSRNVASARHGGFAVVVLGWGVLLCSAAPFGEAQ